MVFTNSTYILPPWHTISLYHRLPQLQLHNSKVGGLVSYARIILICKTMKMHHCHGYIPLIDAAITYLPRGHISADQYCDGVDSPKKLCRRNDRYCKYTSRLKESRPANQTLRLQNYHSPLFWFFACSSAQKDWRTNIHKLLTATIASLIDLINILFLTVPHPGVFGIHSYYMQFALENPVFSRPAYIP